MKKIIFLLMIILSFSGYSQERKNDVLPHYEKKASISNSIGWTKNSYGEWMKSQNKILPDLGKDQKSLQDFQVYGLGFDNFINIDIGDITINDTINKVIIKKFKDGEYTYPSINRGWSSFISYSFFVFDKSQLELFKNLKTDTLNTIKIRLKCEDVVKNIQTFNVSKEVNKLMKQEIPFSNLQYKSLSFSIYINKEKTKVRYFMTSNEYLFPETNYYEVSYDLFNSFIKLE